MELCTTTTCRYGVNVCVTWAKWMHTSLEVPVCVQGKGRREGSAGVCVCEREGRVRER